MRATRLGHPFITLNGRTSGLRIPAGSEVPTADIAMLAFDGVQRGPGATKTADERAARAWAAKGVWAHMNKWSTEAHQQLLLVLGFPMYLKACAFAAREKEDR